jgi:hypothetical protein
MERQLQNALYDVPYLSSDSLCAKHKIYIKIYSMYGILLEYAILHNRCSSIPIKLFVNLVFTRPAVVTDAMLWIRIRISLSCWIRIRIQEGKNDLQI